MRIEFTKMHGLGNDFVIVDQRNHNLLLGKDQIIWLANRRRGIGCDQVIVISAAVGTPSADAELYFYNPDGSMVGACGNGTRCAAAYMAKDGSTVSRLRVGNRILAVSPLDSTRWSVDMGQALFDWRDIPLATPQDTLRMNCAFAGLDDAVAVNIGNPHLVIFTPDCEIVDLANVGAHFENHTLFPERTNVEIVTIQSDKRIRMRVWERGTGITQACGSGACAVLAAAHRRGLTGRRAEIVADGGCLGVTWRDDDHMILSGPVCFSFTGIAEID